MPIPIIAQGFSDFEALVVFIAEALPKAPFIVRKFSIFYILLFLI